MHVDARRAQAGREDRDQRGTRRAHEHRNPCGGDEPDLLAALSTRDDRIAIRQGGRILKNPAPCAVRSHVLGCMTRALAQRAIKNVKLVLLEPAPLPDE